MKRKRDLQSLREAGYHYLGTRARSRQEMKRFLEQKTRTWNLSPSFVDPILEELTNHGLLNDSSFGETWIQSKLRHRSYGPQKLLLQLRQKGLNTAEIQEAIQKIPEAEWLDAATSTLAKYLHKIAETPEQERKQKAYQYLLRKGFSARIAERAFDAVQRTG